MESIAFHTENLDMLVIGRLFHLKPEVYICSSTSCSMAKDTIILRAYSHQEKAKKIKEQWIKIKEENFSFAFISMNDP